MKWYIRHYDEKHWYNFIFEGKVFFWQKKFGFYAMRKSPTIYLGKFAENVKSIYVFRNGYYLDNLLNMKCDNYFELEENDTLEITYTDNSVEKVCAIYNSFLHSYNYI